MSKYCIKCGAEIDDQGRFCPVCGTDQLPKIEPTNVICPKCGTTYPIGVKFCTKCGFQLGKAHSNDNPKDFKEIFSRLFGNNPERKPALNKEIFKEQFLSFEGRINRLDYFLKSMSSCLVFFIIACIIDEFVDDYYMEAIDYLACFIGLIAFTLLVWINSAISVRRLHDLDKDGLLVLLTFVPLLNGFFELYLLFAPGTVGDNRYGQILCNSTFFVKHLTGKVI